MTLRPLAALALLLAATPLPGTAQRPLRVFISVDMEGISGITGDHQLSPAGSEYALGRRLMVDDANAAIRGAFAGGATEVVVNDSHGWQRNLLPTDIDPRARLVSHGFKRHGMMEGLDSTFTAVVFVGYHAKAGAPRGLFAHTGSGVLRDLAVNGRSIGEGGMNALLADWHGVPVVAVTGDDAAVDEVRASAPGARGVVVKRAINTRAVELVPLADARRDIEAAVRQGVAEARRSTPARREAAYTVRMEFRDPTIPEVAAAFREVRLVSPTAVEFTRDAMPDAYRLIRVLYRFINTD